MIEYASNLTELETIFTNMGFEKDESILSSNVWYYTAQKPETVTSTTPCFILTWEQGTRPFVYRNSAGDSITAFLAALSNTTGYSIKIEYYKLYNGGLIFRGVIGQTNNIVNITFDRMLCFAIIPSNNNSDWNIIYNTATNATGADYKLDTANGIVGTLATLTSSNTVNSLDISILTKVYNNRDGIIDGEVYYDIVPHASITDTLFTQVNGIDYVLGFGVTNQPYPRFAFRLADPT